MVVKKAESGHTGGPGVCRIGCWIGCWIAAGWAAGWAAGSAAGPLFGVPGGRAEIRKPVGVRIFQGFLKVFRKIGHKR